MFDSRLAPGLLSVYHHAQSCLIFVTPVDCSTPGFRVLHQLLELADFHPVGDAIQPSHPLSSAGGQASFCLDYCSS